MMEEKIKFRTIDEYISSFPDEVISILEKLRRNIRKIAPEAEEKISYNIGAFKLNGSFLIYYAGWKQHISIYPIPPGNVAFNKAISAYKSGKSTLKFLIGKPIPWDLITETVKLSVSGNLKRIKARTPSKKKAK